MQVKKQHRPLTAKSIYRVYVSDLSDDLKPTEKGERAILQVLRHAMDEEKDDGYENVTYQDICKAPRIDYNGFKGAAFLSLCSINTEFVDLSKHFPNLPSILIMAAKQLGIGNALQRSIKSKENIPTRLFAIIVNNFPELAYHLLQESREWECFPDLEYANGKIMKKILQSAHPKLMLLAIQQVPDRWLECTFHDLIELVDDRPKAHCELWLMLTGRFIDNPGIWYISSSVVSKFGLRSSRLLKRMIDICMNHLEYTKHAGNKIKCAIGSSLLHIDGLCFLVEQYLFLVK